MKTRLFFIFAFLLATTCIVAQNRKGGLRLNPSVSQYELYVSFYPNNIVMNNDTLCLKTASVLNKKLKNLKEEYSFQFEKGIDIPDINLQKIRKSASLRGANTNSIDKLNRIYKVVSDKLSKDDLLKIATKLEAMDEVEYACLTPCVPIKPPYDIPPVTPNMESSQTYLRSNPGVNAYYAWERGLTGEGVRVHDIEYGLNPDHEDLNEVNVSIAQNMDIQSSMSLDHGTAVAGIMCAGNNGYGITGIAHNIDRFILYPEYTSSGYNRIKAVTRAIMDAEPGDIILYEMQIYVQTTEDYVPAEYNNVVWDLTKAATDAGVVVIAAAGNGGMNLDDPLFEEYNARGNSGAIIVGAGHPSTRHNKLYFSTYGSRVDVQGWGMDVLSIGYGDYMMPGDDINQKYTMFSGTSSATPIVGGCAAILQSYYHSLTGNYMTSPQMRELLIETGLPQRQEDVDGHIGPFPNLEQAIIQMERLASIEEAEKKESFAVYPTLVTDHLNIVSGQAENDVILIDIYTPDGKLSCSPVCKDGIVDTSTLTKGVYLVRISGKYNSTTAKIVKK
ncbi:hypothetical protein M2132_001753 [Dysgonomonas sp. PH5-45]|uniref:S8 family peptidase n=1 Tax=unclassified Dysgonomonas TaxID=2630389 RepID=UPI0024745FB1|nr:MULTISPECIES: S8 family peptidase [unclassified Dysgonomonas]MDH6355411.1 hypothetical protein [Dysgonomonas sp. PH5-45]MDH6388308.1 hypothetical protein [Dysgonomonas sp. PH5-37]